MSIGVRSDPFLSYRFVVEIDGIISAGFSEVTGLDVEIETEEYQEGGVNTHSHTLPTRATFPNLTLRRGITDQPLLYKWTESVVNGRVLRLPVLVFMLDEMDVPTWGWSVHKAYPVKWTGPELQADQSTVAMEAIELAHTGVSKIQGLPTASRPLRELI
jgi:phage tail-like protein